MKEFQAAFSLLELLITLAIIAMLCAVIYPNYQNHTIKTKRAQAKVALLDLASALEQYHLLHHSYENATLAALNRSEILEKSSYRLQIQSVSKEHYMIEAVPFGPQTKDTLCATFIYDNKGEKSITGTGATAECW